MNLAYATAFGRSEYVTLLSDMKNHVYHDLYAFRFDPDEASFATKSQFVEDEVWDDSHRWYVFHRAVFSRDNQFVAVIYPIPATELQEVDGDSCFDIYPVYAEEVTKVIYRKVRDE